MVFSLSSLAGDELDVSAAARKAFDRMKDVQTETDLKIKSQMSAQGRNDHDTRPNSRAASVVIQQKLDGSSKAQWYLLMYLFNFGLLQN